MVVDAQMVQDAGNFAMALIPALERTLSGSVKAMITQCSMRHLYQLPASNPHKQNLISVAQQCERRRCNHHTLDDPLSTLECLQTVIDPKSVSTDRDLVNKFNYVVAAQDEQVRRWCRGVRGTPLIFVKRSVMIMEPMAEASERVRDGLERSKFRVGIRGNPDHKRKRDDDAPASIKKVKQGPREPNPLSVKKSKPKEIAKPLLLEQDPEPQQNPARRRRRKHKSGIAAGD